METMIKTFLAFCLALAVLLAVLPAQAAEHFASLRNLDEIGPSLHRGELIRVMLMPVSLGGDNEEENFAYLPPEAAQAKANIDAMLAPMVAAHEINFYQARTRYKNDSIVPSEVLILVEGPKVMRYRIKVW